MSSLSNIRLPLSDSTNDLNAPNMAARHVSSEDIQGKHLRRKASVRAFQPQADSSESIPSAHSSIFDAIYYGRRSSENIDWTGRHSDIFMTGGLSLECPSMPQVPIPLSEAERAAESISPPRHSIHHPTPLETITEQKSIATLRPQASQPLREKPSLLSPLSEMQSSENPKRTKSPSHKKSFSLNDLTLFRHRHHFSKTSSTTSTVVPLTPPENFYPYPAVPPHQPPPRIPTPPGLPTFNTPAAATYRLSYPSVCFRDFFRLRGSPEEQEWRAQNRALPRGAIMRGDDGVIVRGKFRAGQSGHTGVPMGSSRARRAGISALPLRFGGQGDRDGRVTFGDLRAQAESTDAEHQGLEGVGVGSGEAGVSREQAAGKKESMSSRFGKWFCYTCCEAEMAQEELARPNSDRGTVMVAFPKNARLAFEMAYS